MKKQKSASIKSELLMASLIPLLLVGTVILVMGAVMMKKGMEEQVLDGLLANAMMYRDAACEQDAPEGDNTLEVKVINLWPNRLIGDLQPGAKRHWTYESSHFYTKDSPLLPSGLLGPVVLSRIQK